MIKGPPLVLREEQQIGTEKFEKVWGNEYGKALEHSGSFGRSELGYGLDNPAGNNNCFLNTIIQALWQLEGFRKPLLEMVRTVRVCCSCVLDPAFG